MPFKNEWTEDGLIRIAIGNVTGDEVIESRNSIYSDERFDRIRYILSDYTKIESFDISEEDIKKVAYLDMAASNSNPKCKFVLAVPQERIQHLGHYYADVSKRSPWEKKVFETLEEAKEYLGIG